MNLKSLAFKNNEQIPTRYTCDGEKIHPPLEISNPPKHVEEELGAPPPKAQQTPPPEPGYIEEE